MSRSVVDTASIPGWGSDADPGNDPTYPMRRIDDQSSRGMDWDRPAPQTPTVEVLSSIEHRRLPAVTGTATPPSGISGALRRLAFRRSESDWWHWLLLMGADRINVVEGVVEDLGRGRVPNIPAEMGIRAEWRHNRKGLATKLGIVAAGALAGYLLVRGSRDGDRSADAAGHAGHDRPGSAAIGADIHPAMRPS
ncbi:hypothetical protein [Sphingomonas sp. CFBP 8760]|uniref:hypothetical protein n=1 Tax=Sphingomonas sp. CFBP 8760 TaxID=2775282 RepID=UPI0018FE3365|nr:hypothetical protein [Sphingomonas sp. CFBP 8760]